MFHLNKQDSSGDLEKTKADFKHYFELKSELEDATRQFKETGTSPLNAEQFESKLKEMEALKAEYPILDTGYGPDAKRQIFQDLFTRIFAIILIFITFLFAVNWIAYPSAVSKIVMFWDSGNGGYSFADKITLTAKFPIMCWLVLPADREDIDLKLDSSIQNYVNNKLAIDSNYFTWNSNKYLLNPSLKEAHFIYDNNYIGAKFDYILKKFVNSCNSLRKQDTSYIDYDLKASVCNHEMKKFKIFTKVHSQKPLDQLFRGNLFYAIRKKIESYRPLPTRIDSFYIIKDIEF
jgi:hypothetical protein